MPPLACNFCARSFDTRGLFNEHVAPYLPELLKHTRLKATRTTPFHPIPILRECLRLNDTKKRRPLLRCSSRPGANSVYAEFGRQMTTLLHSTGEVHEWELRNYALLDEAWWTGEVNRVFTAAVEHPQMLAVMVADVYANAAQIAYVPAPVGVAHVPLEVGAVRPLDLSKQSPAKTKRVPGIMQTANGCFTQAGAVTALGGGRVEATTVRHQLLQKAIVISDDDSVYEGSGDEDAVKCDDDNDDEEGIRIGEADEPECDPLFLLSIVVFGMKTIVVPVFFNTPLSELVAAATKSAERLVRVLPRTTAFVDHHGAVWDEEELMRIKIEEGEKVGEPGIVEAEYKGRY